MSSRRPNRAERVGPSDAAGSDQPAVVAPAPGAGPPPAQLPPPPRAATAVCTKLLNASIVTNVGELAVLVSDMPEVVAALRQVSTACSRAPGVGALAVGPAIPAAVAAAAAVTQPPPPPYRVAAASHTPPRVSSSSSSSAGSTGGGHTPPYPSPAAGSSRNGGGSYSSAVKARHVVKFVAGMPHVWGTVNGKRVKLNLDSGCGASSLSYQQMAADWDALFGPNSLVELVDLATPIQVTQFTTGHQVLARQALINVPVQIGDGIYPMDLMLIEDSAYGYAIGFDYHITYGMVLISRGKDPRDARSKRLQLALPPERLAPGAQPRQRPDWARHAPWWYPRQSVPLEYTGQYQNWRIAASS